MNALYELSQKRLIVLKQLHLQKYKITITLPSVARSSRIFQNEAAQSLYLSIKSALCILIG